MPINLADPTHKRIDDMVKSHEVFLFMKGNRMFPQCGFSATVVGVLDELGAKYETFNILEDAAVREGAKVYSDWPTFPQLYVKGELVGGADIIRNMYSSGELHALLGVQAEEVAEPTVTVTEAAAEVLAAHAEGERHKGIRIEVGANFQYGLMFSEERPGDFKKSQHGLTILIDRSSAKRADGLVLDFSKENKGFVIENPNEPPKVKQKSVKELKAALDANPALKLYDVRTADERATALIEGAIHLTAEARQELLSLPKDTEIWLHCHHGGRSNQAAEQLLAAGFTNVTNVKGGIDAWSREVDASVPRY